MCMHIHGMSATQNSQDPLWGSEGSGVGPLGVVSCPFNQDSWLHYKIKAQKLHAHKQMNRKSQNHKYLVTL
jgi:hypothetical protein